MAAVADSASARSAMTFAGSAAAKPTAWPMVRPGALSPMLLPAAAVMPPGAVAKAVELAARMLPPAEVAVRLAKALPLAVVRSVLVAASSARALVTMAPPAPWVMPPAVAVSAIALAASAAAKPTLLPGWSSVTVPMFVVPPARSRTVRVVAVMALPRPWLTAPSVCSVTVLPLPPSAPARTRSPPLSSSRDWPVPVIVACSTTRAPACR
jgi:hypothetical protein